MGVFDGGCNLSDTLVMEIEAGIPRITLNRPEKKNALTRRGGDHPRPRRFSLRSLPGLPTSPLHVPAVESI
jgi:hypothetical protein